jgi:2'-5' RNA ligase
MLINNPKGQKPRLFFGFGVSQAFNDQCGKLPGKGLMVHWTPPGDRHITLRYLGECENQLVTDLDTVIDGAIRKKAFHIHIQGLNLLGKSPVLVAEIASLKNCVDLKGRLEDKLETLGIGRDQRDYYPHVTLARNKARDGGRKLKEYTNRHSGRIDTYFRLRHFSLYESNQPDHTGLRYRELARFALS